MSLIDPALDAALRQRRVEVREPDSDTLVLRRVPVNRQRFNKASTNVLLKRPRRGAPVVIGVDEDLEYAGPDAGVARAFAGAARQGGWRVIMLDTRADDDLTPGVERALAAVGFDGGEPVLEADVVPASGPAGPPDGTLARFAVELTGEREVSTHAATLGRREEIADLVAILLERDPRLPVIVGPPGAGKTNLLKGVAIEWRRRALPGRLLAIDVGVLFAGACLEAERENLLRAVLEEAAASPGTALALERIDLTLAETTHGPYLLARALAAGRHLLGTTLPAHIDHLLGCPPLAMRLHTVDLSALTADETREVLEAAAPALARHHGVRIDPVIHEIVAERAAALIGVLPGIALLLLDAAAARARLDGADAIDPAHVFGAAARCREVDGEDSARTVP